MKYLKEYDAVKDKSKFYWQIRTDEPFLEIALHKFDLTQKEINNWIFRRNRNSFNDEIYIAPYDIEYTISWLPANIEGKKWLENNGYVYKGKMKYTDEDFKNIDAILTSNKYNI